MDGRNLRNPIGAEARGKLRVLKAKLQTQFDRSEHAINDPGTWRIVAQFSLRSSSVGRSRALTRLCKAVGPSAHLERASIDGAMPMVTWVRLTPRHSVAVDSADLGL